MLNETSIISDLCVAVFLHRLVTFSFVASQPVPPWCPILLEPYVCIITQNSQYIKIYMLKSLTFSQHQILNSIPFLM